jgi:hypothetical protein
MDKRLQNGQTFFTFTRALEDAGEVRQVISIIAPDIGQARALLVEHVREIGKRSGRRMPEYLLHPPFEESQIEFESGKAQLVVSMFEHIHM